MSSEPTKVFFDTESTGLHQHTTLISIGAIAENGETFYAEFADFDCKQVDNWISENVIKHLRFYGSEHKGYNNCSTQLAGTHQAKTEAFGNTHFVKNCFFDWLTEIGDVEMWSDCLAYDWVLFNELIGGAMSIPQNVYYIPFDICTMFKLRGIDPDISREGFTEDMKIQKGAKHNALQDAIIIKACYDKLMKK
jgi:hypothetical protein